MDEAAAESQIDFKHLASTNRQNVVNAKGSHLFVFLRKRPGVGKRHFSLKTDISQNYGGYYFVGAIWLPRIVEIPFRDWNPMEKTLLLATFRITLIHSFP